MSNNYMLNKFSYWYVVTTGDSVVREFIDVVMKNQEDLVKPLVRLKPLAVVKG